MFENEYQEPELMAWRVRPPSREYQSLDADVRSAIDRHLLEIPVKLGAMAENLGIKVLLSTFSLGISGKIGGENGSFVIRINRHEVRYRQRFTLAHEISHFLLHREMIESSKDGVWSENVLLRSGAPMKYEYEANRLASDLIIPSDRLLEETKNTDSLISNEGVQDLADKFEVSVPAMKLKLQIES